MQTNIIFHTIRLILCFQQAGEIDNLTVKLGQSILIVLCRFHVGAGIPGVAPHYISPPSTFNVLLDSYWFDKPWFLTEGKLAAVRITPSSWGSQRTCALPSQAALFLAPLPGRSRHAARGVSHIQSLYFVYCLALLYFIFCLVCFLYIKNTKKLVTCIYFIYLLFISSCFPLSSL